MRPMSLWESGESTGMVSLADLFAEGEFSGGESKASLEDVAFSCCRGGWPAVVDMTGKIALNQAFDYVEAVTESDISKPDGVNRDPETWRGQTWQGCALENARLSGFRVKSPDCGCNGFGEGMADDLPFEGR